MGDRAMVKIQDGKNPGVYLYTHWGGLELEEDVRHALARNARWNDPAYLARIVFNEMEGDSHGQEDGLGIQVSPQSDLEHPLIVVDTGAQRVRLHPCPMGEPDESAVLAECSMEEAANGALAAAYNGPDA